jgi:formylglycine-generating enzyme required for sulfatase activity
MAAPIFVSHSSKDREIVVRLCHGLETRGIACWISSRDVAPGENYQEAIVRAISRARVMILVFTQNANNSDEIKKEISLASQHKLTVIPVRLEDVVPSAAFAYELATRQWINMFDDWDAAIKRLQQQIAAIMTAQPAVMPGPNGDPERSFAFNVHPSRGEQSLGRGRGSSARTSKRFALAFGLVVCLSAGAFGLMTVLLPPAPIDEVQHGKAAQGMTVAVSGGSSVPPQGAAPDAAPSPKSVAAARPDVVAKPTDQVPMTGDDRGKPPPIVPTPAALSPASPASQPVISAPSAAPATIPTPTAAPLPLVAPTIEPPPSPGVQPSANPGAFEPAPKAPALTPGPDAPGVAGLQAPIAPVASAPPPSIATAPPPIAAVGDGGQVFQECESCAEMVVIPAGTAFIGSPADEPARRPDEGPRQQVRFATPFAVGRYEVSFAEWDACVTEGGCNNWHPGDYGWGRGEQPVIFVSWNDARDYAAWLASKTGQPYRLLSEAEYEYVARACREPKCQSRIFWFGDKITPEAANYNSQYSYAGSPKANARRRALAVNAAPANPFGLYHILGNVRQWVSDCWNPSLQGLPLDGRPHLTGDCNAHVVRGGSWSDEPVELRASARSWDETKTRSSQIGFRVARDLTR